MMMGIVNFEVIRLAIGIGHYQKSISKSHTGPWYMHMDRDTYTVHTYM